MYEIDIKSKDPIYLQIVDQTIQMMTDGTLRDGDRMISIRELATMLGINPATVSKAYKELEERGLIETEKGRGTFISFSKKSLKKQQEKAIKSFKNTVEELKKLSIKKEDIMEVIDEVYSEEDKR